MRYLILILIILILSFLLFKQCEAEPKIITKTNTVTKVEYIRDTVKEVVIGKPKEVYYKTTDTFYRDKIIYVPYNLSDSIKINKYPLSLISNKAKFEGFALTDGKLYDFNGIITYPENIITTTTETIIKKDRGGLYAFLQSNTNFNNIDLGLDWQIKNRIMIGASINHNRQFKGINFTSIRFKLGINLIK